MARPNGVFKRPPNVPREVRLLHEKLSKSDLMEIACHFIALTHPESYDIAIVDGAWLVERLTEEYENQKQRR